MSSLSRKQFLCDSLYLAGGSALALNALAASTQTGTASPSPADPMPGPTPPLLEFEHLQRTPAPAYGPMPWQPHWEIVMVYARPDIVTPGEYSRSGFINRHVAPDVAPFDWSCRIDRNSPGLDQSPTGCHISAASLPPLTGERLERVVQGYAVRNGKLATAAVRGGELYRADDQRSAHQRDWDFLVERASGALDRAGVKDSAEVRDKVLALAADANSCRGYPYPSRHPVDTALHSSYCVGAANLLTAMCHVLGIHARPVHTENHSMTEVHDGKRWFFVDNFSAQTWAGEKDATPRQVFPTKNFVQVLFDPSESANDPMPRGQRARYLEIQPGNEPFLNVGALWWRFVHTGLGSERFHDPLRDGSAMNVMPAPGNVRSVYPEWAEPVFMSRTGKDEELLLNPPQGWCRTVGEVDREMGIRQRFYVGRLDTSDNPVRACRADLHLVHGAYSQFSPTRGRWILQVNGTTVPLDRNAFELRGDILSFHLPINLLRENAYNEVVLSSAAKLPKVLAPRRDRLTFWAWPDVLGQGEPWLSKPVVAPDPNSQPPPVLNTHSAWFLMPEQM